MKIKYYINKIIPKNSIYLGLKLSENLAQGSFYITDNYESILFEYMANSGGWGNGQLEYGDYLIKSYINPTEMNLRNDKEAYTLYGYGWFMSLEPLFNTERFGLGCHPDGNIPGSLGCISIPFKCIEDNIRCFNIMRDYLQSNKSIKVEVINQLNNGQGVIA